MKKLLRILLLLLVLWLLWSMFGGELIRRPAPPVAPDPTPPVARPQPPDLSQPLRGKIDRILIEKGARRLTAYQDGKRVREYRIALGFAPAGDKVMQGDGKTPEGVYKIDRRNDRSKFHLSLGIDYPRPEDRARAKKGGYNPGGDIFIHGQPNQIAAGYRVKGDWTEGCVAIDNPQIEELFAATPLGTEVEIRP
ncbi:L,D-transpeptidase family protein [Paracoccus sp. S1E-3]|uniref:L,D-transpeptidase family protein n=1 Tax=Paracoccus sp. S1E-3 TaxID=2756130 RepID=UPI0015EEDC96|nr:L,D-transpeptidase family protein [Paracoccus sp. S1E-3]MBA4490558.1 L,D-transpeptidase family protein [Paracoccus sp. S1E-3]